MFNSSPELEGQTPVALLHQACPPCDSTLEINFPRQQCLISGSSNGAFFYCQSSNAEQLTAHHGPWHKILEWPSKYGLSPSLFYFPFTGSILRLSLTKTTPPVPIPQPLIFCCNASLTALCSINCQHCEKADTNKGDLAQRDAE